MYPPPPLSFKSFAVTFFSSSIKGAWTRQASFNPFFSPLR